MEITKAVMNSDGPNLTFSVPFAKIDAEARTVSGFATMDNIDTHGDIIPAEASSKAFARWRGNLREMHAPVAVGKVLGFTEEEFYDAESDKMYRGIFVSAYVSKGAEDTWQKVLDGTLTGFSIGGKVLADEEKFERSADGTGRQVRYITDYEMVELSLVDNPANQLCNIFSIVKNADGQSFMKGIAVGVTVENILYCSTDNLAITTERDSADCVKCGSPMSNIGWVESDDSEKTEKVRSAVLKKSAAQPKDAFIWTNKNSNGNIYTNGTITSNPATAIPLMTSTSGYTINISGQPSVETIAEKVAEILNKSKTLEGGVDVAEEVQETKVTTEETETVVEETKTAADNEEVVTPTEEEAPTEETVEKAVEVDEVEKEEVDLSKMFSDFAAQIKDVLTASKEETGKVVESVKAELEETVKALGTKVSELSEKFGALEATAESVAKRVDSVESDTAIKKSADLGGSDDATEETENFWRGSFISSNDLLK